MKVRFNDAEEYLEELQRDHPKLLRLTNSYEFSKVTANIRHVTVIATHLSNDRQLVRLDRYIGELWPYHRHDLTINEKTMKAAEAVQKQITAAAKALKIEVRAGVIEP